MIVRKFRALVGPKPTLVHAGWLCVLSGLALFAVPLAHSPVRIAALVFVWSLVSEGFRPASLAVTGDVVGPEDRKAAFALNRLAINLGMSVGPALGGFLATVSFVFLFVVDGATSLVAGVVLIAAFRVSRLPAHEDDAPGPATAPSRWGALADRRMQIFLAGTLPMAILFFQNIAAMPLYIVRDLGYSERAFGLFVSVNTVIIILFEVPLNLAMADWPHRRSLLIGALLSGLGFGGLAIATGPAAIVATVVVWTLGEMILFPGMAAFVADIAPANRRGAYMGLYTFAWSVAFAVGPWLGTVVLERAGPTPLWTGCVGAGVLAAAVFWYVDAGQR